MNVAGTVPVLVIRTLAVALCPGQMVNPDAGVKSIWHFTGHGVGLAGALAAVSPAWNPEMNAETSNMHVIRLSMFSGLVPKLHGVDLHLFNCITAIWEHHSVWRSRYDKHDQHCWDPG